MGVSVLSSNPTATLVFIWLGFYLPSHWNPASLMVLSSWKTIFPWLSSMLRSLHFLLYFSRWTPERWLQHSQCLINVWKKILHLFPFYSCFASFFLVDSLCGAERLSRGDWKRWLVLTSPCLMGAQWCDYPQEAYSRGLTYDFWTS